MSTDQILDSPVLQGSFEVIDGLELFVRRTDPATNEADVVMVHGLGGMSTNWTDLMHLQSDRGRRCVALDLPGFGRSEADPEGDYSLARHSAAVIDLLETMDGPVNLVGNSLGGAIATTVAAERPDLVRTLTLLAPALPHVKPGLEKLPIVLGIAPRAADLLAWARGNQSAEERVDETMRLVYGDPSRVNPLRRAEAIVEHNLRAGLPHIWHAFVGSSRGLGWGFVPWRREYLWRRLDEVQAPVLAVFGTEDKLVDPNIAGRVARTIGGGTVVMMPGIGHCPQMEVPITVDRLLDAHIEGQL
ncbi:MAG: alpha/beta hydrolase [Actinobacteria bacterium]|nr:MAG: alpha/beta hydrolase [Actinomycetota bacterium]